MKIKQVTVHNYRNIDDITVRMHSECNYIIGENNLGKSNFLSLLNIVCTGKSFDDDDYTDPSLPITIDLQLQLSTSEYGFFGENFSSDDPSLINLRYYQEISDVYPTIRCTDTNETIPLKQIKKCNFYRYESTASPSKELKLDGKRGMGMFMNTMIERFVSEYGVSSFLKDDQMNDLTTFINDRFNKIQGFKNYKIEASVSPKASDLMTRLFYLSDGERTLDTTGAGVQYIAMASIGVLCFILDLYKSKAIPFSERIFTDDDGNKMLPIIMSIDEPEVHLHPFLQRSLIGFYKRILSNKDKEFAELLKDCFGIDGLCGQIIIVTHSTDVLVGDYRNLIRFYKSESTTKIVSGVSLRISDMYEKHLIMHFPELKEAFYAHCVMFVEGVTEYGCMRAFAEKNGVSFDDLGISVISADGEKTISNLQRLLDEFKIPYVAVYDNDVQKRSKKATDFFTSELCFEVEVVKGLYDANRPDIVEKIAVSLYPKATKEIIDVNFIANHYKKMNLDVSTFTPCVLTSVSKENREDFINIYSAWYMAKKGVLLGRIAGEEIPADLVPNCYKNAIFKAKELAENV